MRNMLLLGVVAGIGQLLYPGTPDRARADADRSIGKPVAVEVHDGYFVSNKFEPDKPTSFVAITDQKRFDEVFGVAFVMRDRANRLKTGALKTRMVVAAIHRGNAMWEYKVVRATAEGGTLYLDYTARQGQPGSARFACPLIVSVDKAKYTSVVFVENDKRVATVKPAAATS